MLEVVPFHLENCEILLQTVSLDSQLADVAIGLLKFGLKVLSIL